MARVLVTLAVAALAVGCGSTQSADGGPSTDGGATDAGAPDAGSVDAGLTWFDTCGDAVCHETDAGTEDAGCAAVGASCSTIGQMCGDPNANCGVVEVCASSDPRTHGCPVSTRAYKRDIEYLDDASLARLHDETLGLRLATYRYKPPVETSGAEHLGFIIEDDPKGAAVDPLHHRVDMYGYLSMVVATMQVQEKEIAQLRTELDQARKSVCPAK